MSHTIATVKLSSTSPYSQGKYYQPEKSVDDKNRLTGDEIERRNWWRRAHIDAKGRVFIPGCSFKKALEAASKYSSLQIPGQGKKTYTQKLKSAVMVLEDMTLPITTKQLQEDFGVWVHVPSDGRQGGTSRVLRCFPTYPTWKGELDFHIFDPIVSEEVLRRFLEDAGKFIGIGTWRPEHGGMNGRFAVDGIKWKVIEE